MSEQRSPTFVQRLDALAKDERLKLSFLMTKTMLEHSQTEMLDLLAGIEKRLAAIERIARGDRR